jgi:hypothetical protein
MAVSLPNGTQYAIASAYGPAILVSAASNAAECVLTTATASSYAAGDLVELTSGWTRANARIFRVKAAATTSVTLEGFDTTSTVVFPAGGGGGSVRKITTWVPMPYMMSFELSGGDPKFTQQEFIDVQDELSFPNGFSATSVTITLADDPSLPHHAVLVGASDSQKLTGVRAVLPTGSPLLYNGIIGFNPTPTMVKGQVMAVKAGLSLQGRVVRYAS